MHLNPILVVEDDSTTSRLYQLQLRRVEIPAVFFSCALDALEHARRQPPPLAVLDYELPDIPGTELMNRLHQIEGCESLPTIFVTGRSSPESIRQLIAQGASLVLGKPFSPLELICQVRYILSVTPTARTSKP